MYLCMYDRPIRCHISPFLCLGSPREKSGNSFSEVMPFPFSFFFFSLATDRGRVRSDRDPTLALNHLRGRRRRGRRGRRGAPWIIGTKGKRGEKRGRRRRTWCLSKEMEREKKYYMANKQMSCQGRRGGRGTALGPGSYSLFCVFSSLLPGIISASCFLFLLLIREYGVEKRAEPRWKYDGTRFDTQRISRIRTFHTHTHTQPFHSPKAEERCEQELHKVFF